MTACRRLANGGAAQRRVSMGSDRAVERYDVECKECERNDDLVFFCRLLGKLVLLASRLCATRWS